MHLLPLFLLFQLPLSLHAQTSGSLRCCYLASSPPSVFGVPTQTGQTLEYLQTHTNLSCATLTSIDMVPHPFLSTLSSCTSSSSSVVCDCDLAVGPFMRTSHHANLDYLPAFERDAISVLVVKHRNVDPFFLAVFTPGVWACIFAMTMAFVYLTLMDRRYRPKEKGRIVCAFKDVLGNLIGNSEVRNMGSGSSTRQWVLRFTIFLCGIFLRLAFEASLTAGIFQAQQQQSKFRCQEDLFNCHVEPNEVCFSKGGAIEKIWDKVITTSDCHVQAKTSATRFNSDEESIEALMDPTSSCKFLLISRLSAEHLLSENYCSKLLLVGEPFFSGGVHFVLPKNSSYTETLRSATLEVRTSFVDEDGNFKSGEKCRQGQTFGLQFDTLRTFFYCAYGVFGLLLLVAIWKRVWKHTTKKELDKGVKGEREEKEEGKGSEDDLDEYNSEKSDSIEFVNDDQLESGQDIKKLQDDQVEDKSSLNL